MGKEGTILSGDDVKNCTTGSGSLAVGNRKTAQEEQHVSSIGTCQDSWNTSPLSHQHQELGEKRAQPNTPPITYRTRGKQSQDFSAMPDMISKYKEDIRRDKWKRISQANDDRTKSLFPKENTASILDPYLKKQMTTRFGDKEVITYDKTGVNKLNFQMTKPPDSKDGDGWSEDSISVGTSTTEGMKTPESLPAKLRQLTTSTEQTCPDVPIPLSSLQQSMT